MRGWHRFIARPQACPDDTFSYGDVVTVTGTSTQLAPDDGYGDWTIPWDQRLKGSALT